MLKPDVDALQAIHDFLHQPTPVTWLNAATEQIALILLDHAHCERKAAATAIHFMSKYPEKADLVDVMSPLAREELLHFEKVMALMQARNIKFRPLPPCGYAQSMHKKVTNKDTNERLCEQLIIGALIEARSCERFHALIPYLKDRELAKFYASLVKAESRHFQEYLRLAHLYSDNVDEKIAKFRALENHLIISPSNALRFHSGVPTTPQESPAYEGHILEIHQD